MSPDVTHGIPQLLSEVRRRKPDETLPAVETQQSGFTPMTGDSGTEHVHLQPAIAICLISHARGELNVDFMQWSKIWIKIFFFFFKEDGPD